MTTASSIWRDYEVDGDSSSGPHNVVKSEVRAWGTTKATEVTTIESNVATLQTDVATLQTGTIKSIVRRVFTSSGTYTPTAGMAFADVEAMGGGGAGGGAVATTSPNVAGGSGGAAGGYARKLFSAATIGASQTGTIGARGGA